MHVDCEQVLQIAISAGELIMEHYRDMSSVKVQQKQDNSPISSADLAAHDFITEALAKLTPKIPILSEESDSALITQRQNWPVYWLVDPLDGTKEFLAQNDEFTVNIALIEHHKPVYGFVHVPAMNRSFWNESEDIAYSRKDNKQQRLATRPFNTSNFIAAISRRHGFEETTAFLQQIGSAESRTIGSSLKICLIATAEVDVYPRFGPTSEWDIAAADAILRASGGAIYNTEGQPLFYGNRADILNPSFVAVGSTEYNWPDQIITFQQRKKNVGKDH